MIMCTSCMELGHICPERAAVLDRDELRDIERAF